MAERTDRTGNLSDMKSRINNYIRFRGPSLPIHLSKECKTTLLLASAFLADLVSEKTLKISNLKVGGSPVYFLPGQEAMLEKFHTFLPGRERDAFLMLKEKKILQDDEQEPSIRVALRNIKDFAAPYTIKFGEKSIILWQFHSLNEEEAKNLISEKLENIQPKIQEKPAEIPELSPKVEEKIQEKPIEEKIQEVREEIKAKLEVIEEIPIIEHPKQEKPAEIKLEPIFQADKAKPKPKREKPKPDKFLEEIKQYLTGKNIEIVKVEKFDKKEVTAIIKENSKEIFLLAVDKKRIDEQDMLKAHKKSQPLNISYMIISRGEPGKKLKESIEAFKNLERTEKME